jgi:hypothetical protein
MKAASSFASQALQHLLDQAGEDTDRLRGLFYNYVELAYRLEVHFLFPNLEDTERHLLVGLGSARSAILIGSRNSEHYRDPEQRAQHESTLIQVKQRFLNLRAEVGSRGLANRLTNIQRQLLEREFLTLTKDPAQADLHTARLTRLDGWQR